MPEVSIANKQVIALKRNDNRHISLGASCSKLFIFLFTLYPITAQFVSPLAFLNLGELLLLPFVLCYLIKYYAEIKFDYNLILYYFIPLFLSIVAFFTSSEYVSFEGTGRALLRIIFLLLLITIIVNKADLKLLLRSYFYIAFIIGIILILQYVFHYQTSIELPVPRSYCNVLYEYQGAQSLTGDQYYALFGFRPASLFTEPSYFTFYIAPVVALLLFAGGKNLFPQWIEKTRPFLAAAFSLLMLLSSSNAALISIVIIWFSYSLFWFFEWTHSPKHLFPLFTGITICFIAFFILASIGAFDVMISRSSSGGSIGQRFFRGLIIFDTMDPIHQVIGIGVNNHASYIDIYNIATVYDEEAVKYSFIADVPNRLITSGILGLIALICFYIILLAQSRSRCERVLIVILLINTLFNPWQYSFRFAFMIVIIMLLRYYYFNDKYNSSSYS